MIVVLGLPDRAIAPLLIYNPAMDVGSAEFQITRSLSAVSDLAIDLSGRKVVLKKLPDDCCQRHQLHPNVKLRLQRLRELPMASFVNILEVERTERGVVMVSEYVEGIRLDEADTGDRARLTRELRLAVMSMHQLGMVHGAIKPGNVIIGPDGQLRLIDPSPLLHDDPQIDLRAVDRMEAHDHPLPAKAVAGKSVSVEVDAEDRGFRQRTVVAAVALAAVAVGTAVAMAIYLSE